MDKEGRLENGRAEASSAGVKSEDTITTPPSDGASLSAIGKKRTLSLLFLAVFGAFMGQNLEWSILPPLGRELGLGEVQIGILSALGAAALFLSSPLWGRASDLWGLKRILLLGLFGAVLGLLAFAVVSQIGLAGALSVPILFLFVVATRGILFNVSLAAVPVAAQAYVASTTAGDKQRTDGIAALGAAEGAALVLGPAVGGSLAGAAGLLPPLYLAPAFALIAGVLIWTLLPGSVRQPNRSVPPRPNPLDRRLWPFLLTAFGLTVALGAMQITLGFLVQDRLALSAQETAAASGVALSAAGVALVFAQVALVPMLGWPPLRLLRAGIPIAALGFALLVFAGNLWLIVMTLVLLGLGYGLIIPGFKTAPTLLAEPYEQGGIAGLVNATVFLTYIFSPIIGTVLYGFRPTYPYVLGVLLCLLLYVFVFLHPGMRQVARAEADRSPWT